MANKVFNENCEVVIADTKELKQECYKLRHQIFCVERKFDLNVENGMETDHYDDRSLHFLLKYRPKNAYIATGRIVLPDPHNLVSSLPMHKVLDHGTQAKNGLKCENTLKKTCEISRIGFLKEYSRHTSSAYKGKQSWLTRLMQRKLADIGKLGLYRAVFKLALQESKTPNCIFATDPFLVKRFSDIGFDGYEVLDDKLDIYGPVVAIKFNIEEMLKDAPKRAPEGWAITTDNGKLLKKQHKNTSKKHAPKKLPEFTPAHLGETQTAY